MADEELYKDALDKFKEVADQNPGTRLGSFAHLRMAEIHMIKGEWNEAKEQYRLFLVLNTKTHLTPYVLYRLMKANHENSFTGILIPEREIDRDMGPNRDLIKNFKRFYFLYPKSIFIDESRGYYREAISTLAEYERMVGEYYFKRGLYNAAASRFAYLLKTYPNYKETGQVLEMLIKAYEENQQPEAASEMIRIRDQLLAVGEINPSGLN